MIYTSKQISAQQQKVEEAASNRRPYEQGRFDYMREKIVAPRNYTTTERLQWEAGWEDEHFDRPRPFEEQI